MGVDFTSKIFYGFEAPQEFPEIAAEGNFVEADWGRGPRVVPAAALRLSGR